MEKFVEDAYDYLSCLIILSLPYSIKAPNILLIALAIAFLTRWRQWIRLEWRSLKTGPLLVLAAFSCYLWIKALLSGTIAENKYDLLLIPFVILLLFQMVGKPHRLLIALIVSACLLMVPAIFNIIDFYQKNQQILPFEGTRINDILGMERPYLGFLILTSIIASLSLIKVFPRFRTLFLIYPIVASAFIFLISARISSGTIVMWLGIFLLFYLTTSLWKKALITGILMVFVAVLFASLDTLRERFFLSGNFQESLAKLERHEPRFIIWPCAVEASKSPEHNVAFGLLSEKQLSTMMTDCYDRTITNRHRATFFVRSALNTHNQFLNVYLTSGILGILFLGGFFFYQGFMIRRDFQKMALTIALLLFFLVENVLHRQIGVYYLGVLLWFLTSAGKVQMRRMANIQKGTKNVLIVDWLDKYGGAERVIAVFQKLFRFDTCYTLANTMNKEDFRKIFPDGAQKTVVSPLRFIGKKFRVLFFVFPYMIRFLKIDPAAELIISSSHAVAKGVRKSHPRQLHISYFQARNFNYIWSDYKLYFGKCRHLIYPLILMLRAIDIRHSRNPDYIISNSRFVRDWVLEKYGRDSEVIYPPVNLEPFKLEPIKEDYYIMVGRLVYVKRFDVAIKAFNANGRRLIIIGDGDQGQMLRRMASKNIEFKGFLSSSEVARYVSKAKAFIQPGIEGFGIAPIEAQACGTPVIAFGQGGVTETVADGKTGVFFYEQTEESLAKAISKFEGLSWDPIAIREHSMKFSSERFEIQMTEYVNRKLEEHRRKVSFAHNS